MKTKAPISKTRTWYIREGAIINYSGTEKEIFVPNEISGQPISKIGPYAFSPAKPKLKEEVLKARESIESIRIAEGISSIDEHAFEGCTRLNTVDFPQTMKYIGENAFSDCDSIQNIELNTQSITIGRSAFANCSFLQKVILSPHIEDKYTVAFKCFEKCKSLTEVILPCNMSVIPMMMFYDCKSLSSINLPSTIKEIQTDAFHGCASLKRIEIPASVKTIGIWAFYGCVNLEEIIFKDNDHKPVIESGAFAYCKKLKPF